MFRLEEVGYRDILAIDSLVIPHKKITCIVGESGSGKTTLLRLLNKMISTTQGEIYYNDEAISKIDSIQLRRDIVMLPQAPAVFNGSVKDNLLIGLKFSEKQLPEDEKLLAVLQMVHLGKPLDNDADKLSGGEKQRLSLARILLMKPEVFLLDEPSSALDEDTEKLIVELMVSHTQQMGKTLIMVTHSKKVAERYADITIELKNGRVLSIKGE